MICAVEKKTLKNIILSPSLRKLFTFIRDKFSKKIPVFQKGTTMTSH